MNKYLGLFIDDDQKNFESIKRLFSLKNIQLLPYENLPQDINEIYQKVIDQNVDFVIIDYDLGKQAVKYTGIDVLKNIREQDASFILNSTTFINASLASSKPEWVYMFSVP